MIDTQAWEKHDMAGASSRRICKCQAYIEEGNEMRKTKKGKDAKVK